MPAHILDCCAFEALMTDYLDEALDVTLLAAFELHFGTCERCRGRLNQLRRIPALLRAHLQQQPSAAARQRALEAFRAWKLQGC